MTYESKEKPNGSSKKPRCIFAEELSITSKV
jgi:hypothetical protein